MVKELLKLEGGRQNGYSLHYLKDSVMSFLVFFSSHNLKPSIGIDKKIPRKVCSLQLNAGKEEAQQRPSEEPKSPASQHRADYPFY